MRAISDSKCGLRIFVFSMSCWRLPSGSRHQGGVPILPNGFVDQAAYEISHVGRGAFVGDIKLLCRVDLARTGAPLAGAKVNNAALFGMMKFFLACTGVTAGLSMAAGA